jgi:hypothetical protein
MTNQGIDRAAISREVRRYVAEAALESLRKLAMECDDSLTSREWVVFEEAQLGREVPLDSIIYIASRAHRRILTNCIEAAAIKLGLVNAQPR